MEKLYDIDFAALSRAEKVKLIYNFQDLAEKSFEKHPFETAVNANIFIFTRWWNSYRLTISENDALQIFERIIQNLWDYQEGRLERSEFVHFSKCLKASVRELATGDTEMLDEDKAYYDFYDKYFEKWDCIYDEFIIALTNVCEGICEHKMNWRGTKSVLTGVIAANIEGPVVIKGLDNEAYEKWQQRWEELCDSDRFRQIVTLFQKDMKTAVEGRPLAELRAVYQNEYVFPPEDVTKILRWINCVKTDGYEQ